MIDQQIEIPTRDGHTTTFISHPERGGPFPVIIFYMDAPAIREELRDMARRLATSGYYVMLPNLYYRSGVMEIGPIPPDPEAPERKRMFGYMNSINIPLVMEDTTRPARLCRQAAGRERENCRHGRLLHERAICDQRGDAFSGSRQGRRIDLRNASGHRPARQPASGRTEDQGRTLFRLRRNRHLRAAGDHRQGNTGDE